MAAAASELNNVARISPEQTIIVAELKSGSEQAYARLVEQYRQPIYNLIYRIVNDPADAVDTTQEVFLKVYCGIKGFSGASSLKTWMYRIAINEAFNQRRWWSRHKSREIPMEPQTASPDGALGLKDSFVDRGATPFKETMRRELRERIDGALRNLREPYRTAIVMRDLEGLSYEEIAQITRTSMSTVRSRLVRGRQALKKQFESMPQPAPAGLNRCAMRFACGD